MEDVKELFRIMGVKEAAMAFFYAKGRRKMNYYPEIYNYFRLFLKSMHKEILTKEQKELLTFLKSCYRKFYLVGGTAFALHPGHRRSVHFGLYCYKPFKKSYVK